MAVVKYCRVMVRSEECSVFIQKNFEVLKRESGSNGISHNMLVPRKVKTKINSVR